MAIVHLRNGLNSATAVVDVDLISVGVLNRGQIVVGEGPLITIIICHSVVVGTVDLDRFNSVKKAVTSIGFKENVDFIPIGINESGKQCMEGLIPTEVNRKVYADNPDLAQKAIMATGEAQKSAKNEIKKKLIEVFKQMPIQDDTHQLFYELTKKINKAFK